MTVVADLGGSARLVAAIGALHERVGATAPATVAEPGCLEGQGHLRLRSRSIPGGPSAETRLDLVDALRALGARRSPPGTVVVVVSPGTILDTVQTVLEDPVVRRICALDAVIAAADAPRLSTRSATAMTLLSDDELVAVGIADRIALVHSVRLTPDAHASVHAALGAVAPHAPLLSPAVAPVTADRMLGIDAWTGPHWCADLPRSAGPSAVTLRAAAPLVPEAVDAWSAMLRDELGPELWRLQGRVVLRGGAQPLDCVGVRSFCASSPSRVDAGSDRSTLTIIGRDLPVTRISSGFRAAVAD